MLVESERAILALRCGGGFDLVRTRNISVEGL